MASGGFWALPGAPLLAQPSCLHLPCPLSSTPANSPQQSWQRSPSGHPLLTLLRLLKLEALETPAAVDESARRLASSGVKVVLRSLLRASQTVNPSGEPLNEQASRPLPFSALPYSSGLPPMLSWTPVSCFLLLSHRLAPLTLPLLLTLPQALPLSPAHPPSALPPSPPHPPSALPPSPPHRRAASSSSSATRCTTGACSALPPSARCPRSPHSRHTTRRT